MGLLSKLKTALGLGDRPAQGKPDAPRPKANAADGQRPDGSVECGDAFLEGCGRGVLQPRIDVSGLAQVEEPCGMVATPEAIGRRRPDRDAA